MSLINNLCARLVRHPKRVVFPEGNDARILQAARKFASKNLGTPILLGNRLDIKNTADRLDIKLDSIRVIDHLKSEERALFKETLRSKERFQSHTDKELNNLLNNASYFATLMANSQTDNL